MLNYNTEENTKFNVIYLGILVLILLLLTNGFFLISSNEDGKYLKNEVKQIKSGIEKYQSENKKLSEKIVEYEKILVKIDSNISRNNKKIDILKNNTNEKINSFKSYDADMWEKFFTDRYKK
jgi:peptidoglycan hydrolase CwlO-like protein